MQFDLEDKYKYSNLIEINSTGLSEYRLMHNYPNPFNPTTVISYSFLNEGPVSLKVCDILGSKINSPGKRFRQAGIYSVNFDASQLTSRVYFYKLQAGDNFNSIKKMILVH